MPPIPEPVAIQAEPVVETPVAAEPVEVVQQQQEAEPEPQTVTATPNKNNYNINIFYDSKDNYNINDQAAGKKIMAAKQVKNTFQIPCKRTTSSRRC